jgi:hypothetical protein
MTTVDDLADVRAGDKGDTLILAVLPRDPADIDRLQSVLTTDRVAERFGLPVTSVARRVIPGLPALVLELTSLLGGGVTGSLGLDGHGKTLGYHLLGLELDD